MASRPDAIQSIERLKKLSASSTKLSVESPLSPVEAQLLLSSGKDPFANRTLEGVFFNVIRRDGDTGAEHRLEGARGDSGYMLL